MNHVGENHVAKTTSCGGKKSNMWKSKHTQHLKNVWNIRVAKNHVYISLVNHIQEWHICKISAVLSHTTL